MSESLCEARIMISSDCLIEASASKSSLSMPYDYIDPVAKLLTYGNSDIKRMGEAWPNYLELGFTNEHVPDLVRMATDSDLSGANQNELKVWAPLHAWRTLGQLGADEAAAPLANLFDKLEGDDWLSSELPKVFSMMGPATIPALADVLQNDDIKALNRISIPKCLEEIAKHHPECREGCVGILTRFLERYETNDPVLNAFLISGLVDLSAVESIDVIRASYAMECVDLAVLGDVEDVEIEMGIRTSRATPPPRINLLTGLPQWEMFKELDESEPNIRRAKVGRNDPCPCGSGKKFKKCCLQ